MFTIVEKRRLNDSMTLMAVDAPFIAKKAQAGQFIILRVNEYGERIPLTIADYDREKGTVTIIYQKVGKTTLLLDTLEVGDALPSWKAIRKWRSWAAAQAVPLPIPRQKPCITWASRWMSLRASATKTSSFWRTRCAKCPTTST